LAGAFAAGWGARGGDDPGVRSVDVGFLRDMSDHHEQAVRLALLELQNGEEALVRAFATDVIASQRYELGLMEARLTDWGHGRGAVGRTAMAWMGMSSAVATMPGMVSPDRFAQLAAARGRAADGLFLELMIGHHEGALHMARYAESEAGERHVRELAQTIAAAQRIEIADMEQLRERLGLR
jgi:uncharacterized protein (DUF305 family)